MSSSISKRYSYSPLERKDSIRFLEKLSPNGDGSLNFRMHDHIHLRRYPVAYHCLSYTWGNPYASGRGFQPNFEAHAPEYAPESMVAIYVNGKALPVTKSLFEAQSAIPDTAYADHLESTFAHTPGTTVLHEHVSEDLYPQVERDIYSGARVNAIDNQGRLPIHIAAKQGFVHCIEVLLRGGSAWGVADNAGKTPLQLAKDNDNQRLVELFEWLTSSGVSDPFPRSMFEDGAELPTGCPATWFWVDAVCVNQDDVEEKSAQVEMMDEIYKNAYYTLIWLGPSDNHTEAGLRAVTKLAGHREGFMSSAIEPYDSSNPELYTAAGVPFVTNDEWKGLASIFRRQWFRRMWVIQ